MSEAFRLAVSNLAWEKEEEAEAAALLVQLGVQGVEIAPTRIASWDELTPAKLLDAKTRLMDAGLSVPALQAILFGKPELQLLGPSPAFQEFSDHMRRVADIAATLGAKAAVFGAPNNRRLHDLEPEAALETAVARLSSLAPYFADSGSTLVIEPVPPYYNGSFLTVPDEAATLVRKIDHPGVRLHLDTGCAHLGRADIVAAITTHASLLAHFHIAEPDLSGFDTPLSSHDGAAAALKGSGYAGWISIEMRATPTERLDAVRTAVTFVQSRYL